MIVNLFSEILHILAANNIKIEVHKESLPIKLASFKDASEAMQRKCLFSSLRNNKLMKDGGINLMFWGQGGIFILYRT